MNILITAGIFPPDIGGPANFVPRVAEWLSDRGHNIQVICWSDCIQNDDYKYGYAVSRILRSENRFRRFLQTLRLIYKLRNSVDIIFANGLDFEVCIASLFIKKPRLHKVVGDRAWEMARVRGWCANTIDEYQCMKKSIRFMGCDLFRNYSLKGANLIVTPSDYLKKIVSGWGVNPSFIKVIFNSTQLDVNCDKLDLPEFMGKTIVTVCRLVPWKGVDKLIELLKKVSDIRLVIAGDGPDKSALQALARSAEVSGRVIFLGQLSREDVSKLFRRADLFILNSSYEGLPHVILEAMAACVPVIATDVGGTSEVVKHNKTGILVRFGDQEELLSAIKNINSDQSFRNCLIKNALEFIEQHFNEEKCFIKYEMALIELLKCAPPVLPGNRLFK